MKKTGAILKAVGPLARARPVKVKPLDPKVNQLKKKFSKNMLLRAKTQPPPSRSTKGGM